MGKDKHTPHPWKIRYGGMTEADEGFGICGTIDGQGHTVAECWPCAADAERRRQMLADARLIAAAPDLLEALAWYVEQDRCVFVAVADGSVDPERDGVWQRLKARAAIAKAKGEAL